MNTFIDTRLEWRALAGLADSKYEDYIYRTPETFFTNERVLAFTAIRQAHTTYGTASREGIEAMLGKYPQELDVMVNVDLPPVLDQLENLAYKRRLKTLSRQLDDLANQAVPDVKDAQNVLESVSHTKYVDTDLSSGIQQFLDNLGKKVDSTYQYIPTGFPMLDMYLGGEWTRKGLVLIGGTPGTGKTTLAENCMVDSAIDYSVASALMAYEMSKDKLVARMAIKLARVNGDKVACGYVTAEEKKRIEDAANLLNTLPISIVECKGMKLGMLLATMRDLRIKKNVKVFYIDHLQLIPAGDGGNRNESLGEIAQALSDFATLNDCTVILLTQLTKKDGGYSVRDSGNVESIADVFMILSSESKEDIRTVMAEFKKNRDGKLGEFPFLFDAPHQTFIDSSQKERKQAYSNGY